MRKHLLLGCSMIVIAVMATACEAEKQKLSTENLEADAAAVSAPATSAPAQPAQERQSSPVIGLGPVSGAQSEPIAGMVDNFAPPADYENYATFDNSAVKRVADAPVSTFSIDVDSGSYANVRRFLMNGQKPPQDSVRIEEMLNYFTYDYPAPKHSGQPFQATTDLMTTPWNADTKLLRIGIKGYAPDLAERPAANLVFLVDVSGSMQDADKLPLLKSSLRMLVNNLGPKDKITLVTYAGSAGLALPPTTADKKETIIAAIDNLEAGGSTAGGEGIQLAYAKAREAMIDGGINRILLATDGDFNVGMTDLGQLKDMVEEMRKSGIALSTLGFGEGNYNDALMEQIADIGNGNYGYVDSLKEGKRLLVDSLSGTLQTIAKDVKIQIEFNPAIVAEYRLIGYENRALNREDFNDDAKDAGEIGVGHTVTALYEIALVGSKGIGTDPLRYQTEAPTPKAGSAMKTDEFAFLRLRYKAPDGEKSNLIETPLPTAALKENRTPSADDKFAAAVAAFGQYLRGGDRLGGYGLEQIADLARDGQGEDDSGYRAEFIDLVELADGVDG